MKLASWNVNGLRSCLNKNFAESFERLGCDIICLQETKAEQSQVAFSPEGYESFWNSAEKKGYSGTAVFSRIKPLSVAYGIGVAEHDGEGRVITLEFERFYLVNCYTPNSRRGLVRLDYRITWEAAMREYLARLDSRKPIVMCGDLNVAHTEMDIKNAKANRTSAGFSDQERAEMTKLLGQGMADIFRRLNPDVTDAYTWWSYMAGVRERNIGWRIDYFLVSERIAGRVSEAPIYKDIFGSDHCPVGITIDI